MSRLGTSFAFEHLYEAFSFLRCYSDCCLVHQCRGVCRERSHIRLLTTAPVPRFHGLQPANSPRCARDAETRGAAVLHSSLRDASNRRVRRVLLDHEQGDVPSQGRCSSNLSGQNDQPVSRQSLAGNEPFQSKRYVIVIIGIASLIVIIGIASLIVIIGIATHQDTNGPLQK